MTGTTSSAPARSGHATGRTAWRARGIIATEKRTATLGPRWNDIEAPVEIRSEPPRGAPDDPPRDCRGAIGRFSSQGAVGLVDRGPAATDSSRNLRGRVADVLGMASDKVDPDRPLLTMGLDSLTAMDLKVEIETSLGVTLPLSRLLEGATIRDLAEQAAPRGLALRPDHSSRPWRPCQRPCPSRQPFRAVARRVRSAALARAADALVCSSVHADRRRLPCYRSRIGPRGARHRRLPAGVPARRRPPGGAADHLRRRRREARGPPPRSGRAGPPGGRMAPDRGRLGSWRCRAPAEADRAVWSTLRPGERAPLPGPCPEPIHYRARRSSWSSTTSSPTSGRRRCSSTTSRPRTLPSLRDAASLSQRRGHATPTSRAGSTTMLASDEGERHWAYWRAPARGDAPGARPPDRLHQAARPELPGCGSSTSTSIRR